MASSRLQDKVAIVTGSSSGIGRAIALRYANEGAKVVCADLSLGQRLSTESEETTTHEVIQKFGGEAIFVQTDVGEAKQMENLVQEAVNRFGRLDILVNNAGICAEARAPAVCHLTDESMWDTTMRINSKSVFLGCKYALAQMLAQPAHSSGDRGWIINMSSILGIVGGQLSSSYCASKGAVSSLTRQVAMDYAPHRIHVNALCPGYTRTAIIKEAMDNEVPLGDLESRHPFGGLGVPENIAKMAVVLASDDASWVTGVCLPVDGGFTAQ